LFHYTKCTTIFSDVAISRGLRVRNVKSNESINVKYP
jgi:hypothetical protein